jgi:hypothetical protein
MKENKAQTVIEELIKDCNQRGLALNAMDPTALKELKEDWFKILVGQPRKKKIKVIDIKNYDDDTQNIESVEQYIKEFILGDCQEIIEDVYGDEFPDEGFNCDLIFLLNERYYLAKIECGTRWESSRSARRNYIDGIKVLSVIPHGINSDVFDINFI